MVHIERNQSPGNPTSWIQALWQSQSTVARLKNNLCRKEDRVATQSSFQRNTLRRCASLVAAWSVALRARNLSTDMKVFARHFATNNIIPLHPISSYYHSYLPQEPRVRWLFTCYQRNGFLASVYGRFWPRREIYVDYAMRPRTMVHLRWSLKPCPWAHTLPNWPMDLKAGSWLLRH
jgi:hypothetical protein